MRPEDDNERRHLHGKLGAGCVDDLRKIQQTVQFLWNVN